MNLTLYRLITCITLALSVKQIYAELIDLDTLQQDFVLETKQIHIPEYPHAFNPSIIRFQGRLLLSFRYISDTKFKFVSSIGLIWLNEEFEPVGEPYVLSFRDENSTVPARVDDVRLIEMAGRLYIIYADNPHPVITRGGFRVNVAEIISKEDQFFVNDVDPLLEFPGEDPARREKNWVPFDYQGDLLLAYSLEPHLIFKPFLGKSCCEAIALTNSSMNWPWGELRGGTTGLLVDGEYLSFFHSSIDMPSVHSDGEVMAHYFMGAYTFSAQLPFEITKISPEPIFAEGFYNGARYKPYWKPVRVVFPCGYVHDDQFIWISYGREDHECWVVKLSKKGLLKSLVPVEAVCRDQDQEERDY